MVEQAQKRKPFIPFLLIVIIFHGLFLLTFNVELGLKLQPATVAQKPRKKIDALKIKFKDMHKLGNQNSKETLSQYLKHSDDKKSTRLEKYSYKNKVKEILDKEDMLESDPKGHLNKLANKLKAFDLKGLQATESESVKPYQVESEELKRLLKAKTQKRVMYQDVIPTLNNSQVSIRMEVPKGMNIDKLNQLENVFYSFQKRLSLAYINSLFNKLVDMELTNQPQDHLQRYKGTLVAKADFDKDGNIQKIKMVKWSDDEKVQDFFIDVVDAIQSVPNPPKALTKEQDTFSIFYALHFK